MDKNLAPMKPSRHAVRTNWPRIRSHSPRFATCFRGPDCTAAPALSTHIHHAIPLWRVNTDVTNSVPFQFSIEARLRDLGCKMTWATKRQRMIMCETRHDHVAMQLTTFGSLTRYMFNLVARKLGPCSVS